MLCPRFSPVEWASLAKDEHHRFVQKMALKDKAVQLNWTAVKDSFLSSYDATEKAKQIQKPSRITGALFHVLKDYKQSCVYEMHPGNQTVYVPIEFKIVYNVLQPKN